MEILFHFLDKAAGFLETGIMGSRSLNKAMIIGNVGAEPHLATTSNGLPVCTFSVATNRSWFPRGETERREETEWHRVVAFDNLAEVCHQILTKGTKVFIQGRVQNRQIVPANGGSFFRTEIVASEMIALDRRKENEN